MSHPTETNLRPTPRNCRLRYTASEAAVTTAGILRRVRGGLAILLCATSVLASPAPAAGNSSNPCEGLVIVDADGRTNRRATVVQADGYGTICEFERETIDGIIESRGLTPNETERAVVLSYGRDLVQATTFSRVLALIEKEADDPDSLTAAETEVLEWFRRQVLRMELARAEYALAEYDAWEADKCNWQPPTGDEYLTLGTTCEPGAGGVFTGEPLPPSYEEFVSYGAYRFAEGVGGDIARNVSGVSTTFTAVLPVAIAGGATFAVLSSMIALLTLVKAVKSFLFPFVAQGGTVLSLSFFAPAVIITLLTIATIVRFIQITDANQIRPALEADLSIAQLRFDFPAGIRLGSYVDGDTTEEEFLHLLTASAAAHAPRFAPDPTVTVAATPDPGIDTPFLQTTAASEVTLGQSFVFALEDGAYRAWLSDRWWVVERLDQAEPRFLTPILPILPDALVVFDGNAFHVTQTHLGTDVTAAPTEETTVLKLFAPPLSDPTDFVNLVATQVELVPPPEATVSGLPASRSISEGQQATVSGTAEWAGTVEIDWDDGSVSQVVTPNATTGAFSATRTYRDDASGSISVTPVSPLGVDGTVVGIPLTVANVDPTNVTATATVDGSAIGVYGANPGETIDLEIAFADPGLDDTHTIEVDWGDGTVDSGTPGSAFSHEYGTGGSKSVIVTVTDDDGGNGSWSGSIAVNSPPQISGVPDTIEVDEGSPVSFDGTVVDDNPLEVLTIFWGAGLNGVNFIDLAAVNATTGAFSTSRTWPDDATLMPRLRAGDSRGLSSDLTVTVNVVNVAPTITAASVGRADGSSDPVGPLAPVWLSLAFEDPGVGDTHVVEVDWGDGTTTSGASTATYEHAYAAGGMFTASVAVTDDDGGRATRTIEVFVDPTALDVGVLSDTLGSMAEGEPKSDERRFKIIARLLDEVEGLLAAGDDRRAIARLRSAVINLQNLVNRGQDVASERDVVLEMLRAVTVGLVESSTTSQRDRAQELLAEGDGDRDRGDAKGAAGRYAAAARLALR